MDTISRKNRLIMKIPLTVLIILGLAASDLNAQVAEPGVALKEPALESSFNVNPLGLLQFGPIVQYEAKISDRAAIVPYFRYAYLGVLTHLAWTGYTANERLSPASFGIGFGAKGFVSGTGDSFYYGGFMDFNRSKANYNIGSNSETEEIAVGVAAAANFGYRWRFTSGAYVNVGLIAGANFTLQDEERYVSTGELYATYDEVTVMSMAELSFGW